MSTPSDSEDDLTFSRTECQSSIVYESPLTPYNEFEEHKEFIQDALPFHDNEEIISRRYNNRSSIEGAYVKYNKPITIDHNGFTYMRQLVSYIDESKKIQIISHYELSPLVQIIWEIEQVNKQILYYFCQENLIKDKYLRSLMDNEGYIEIDSLTNFPRIKKILPMLLLPEQRAKVLLLAVKYSEPEVFEVKNRLVRLRTSWRKWIIP